MHLLIKRDVASSLVANRTRDTIQFSHGKKKAKRRKPIALLGIEPNSTLKLKNRNPREGSAAKLYEHPHSSHILVAEPRLISGVVATAAIVPSSH